MSVGISLEIDPKGQTIIDTYSPVGLTQIHESQHIMQVKPASYEKASDNQIASPKVSPQNLQMVNDDLLELGPTLYTLTMSDRIYKAIHKIGATKAMSLNITYSAWAVLFGIVLQGNSIDLKSVICGGLIIMGSILAAGDLSEFKLVEAK